MMKNRYNFKPPCWESHKDSQNNRNTIILKWWFSYSQEKLLWFLSPPGVCCEHVSFEFYRKELSNDHFQSFPLYFSFWSYLIVFTWIAFHLKLFWNFQGPIIVFGWICEMNLRSLNSFKSYCKTSRRHFLYSFVLFFSYINIYIFLCNLFFLIQFLSPEEILSLIFIKWRVLATHHNFNTSST